jgi:hypothetical protein
MTRNSHLPGNLGHTSARFSLLQNPDNLLGVQLALWKLPCVGVVLSCFGATASDL